jgi:1,4-alpha-glucan branching enzyme
MRSDQINGKQVRPVKGWTFPVKPSPLHPVWFDYANGAAREVTIAGSFNNWDVSSTPMVRLVRGRWLRVIYLPPGRYEYLFVVDGRCVADPRATESVPNVFGCMNSVVLVPSRTSRNGCVRRTTGRTAGQSKRRVCRQLNARRSLLHPRLKTIHDR